MSNVMDLIQSTTPRRERAERPPVPLLAEAMKAFLQWSKSEHKEHPATYERYKTSSKSLLAFLKSRKPKVSFSRSTKRRRSDSNRCIKVLQTSPLPLGYGAIQRSRPYYNHINSRSG